MYIIATLKPSSHIHKLWKRMRRIGGSLGENIFHLKDGLYTCTDIIDLHAIKFNSDIVLESYSINPDKIVLNASMIPISDSVPSVISIETKKSRKAKPKSV